MCRKTEYKIYALLRIFHNTFPLIDGQKEENLSDYFSAEVHDGRLTEQQAKDGQKAVYEEYVKMESRIARLIHKHGLTGINEHKKRNPH